MAQAKGFSPTLALYLISILKYGLPAKCLTQNNTDQITARPLYLAVLSRLISQTGSAISTSSRYVVH